MSESEVSALSTSPQRFIARGGSGFEVRLDPWDADYGSELPIDTSDEADDAAVDTDVDVSGAWTPIAPGATTATDPLVFVDGVRRIDARVILRRRPTEIVDSLYGEPIQALVHGAFGAYAVGAVVVSEGRATWGAVEIQRLLATGSGVDVGPTPPLEGALRYASTSAPESDADAPLRGIQRAMRAAEERVAHACADAGGLVVADGPLSFGAARPTRGRVVGFVKRLYKLYVGERVAVLPVLPRGTRSPLFAIRAPAGFSRWSWFVRCATPARGDSEWTGLARLEVDGHLPLAEARAIADETTARLPAFAPTRARDPRSPQNLLPIGALEARLRRLLGDRALTRRRIASWIAAEARA